MRVGVYEGIQDGRGSVVQIERERRIDIHHFSGQIKVSSGHLNESSNGLALLQTAQYLAVCRRIWHCRAHSAHIFLVCPQSFHIMY